MAGREKSTRIVKKLKANEERYRELFDSINVCVVVYKAKEQGEDFVIKDFNSAAEKVEKVNRRDVIGKSILEVFPNVKDFGIFEVMQRVWKTEAPESFPAKQYKDKRISGWRENYIYKLPSGDIVAVYEDVTERKKGEAALEEAERRYRIVADFTYDWEFWRSPEGKMLYVSPACERITGYTPAQFMKDPRLMVKIILPEDKDIYAAHQARIKDLVLDQAIYRIKRKDGNVCWIEHICRPILDDKGTFLGTRGSNRDITDRKQAEEKLEESEDKFRLLFDTANEGIAVGQEGRVKYFNPKFAGILGYSMEEIQSKYLSEYIFPEDRDYVLNDYLKSLQGEKTNDILPFRIVSKSGEIRWVEIRFVPINWEGKPATLNFANDITERKLAEDALRKSEDKYRTILEKMDEAYYETDLKGNLTFFNDALPRLMGYIKDELLGMNYRQYVPAAILLAHKAAFNEVYRTGVPCELHRQPRIKKDGSMRYVDLSVFPVRNAAGEIIGFRGISRDITARLKTEEELELRAELLDSATDSIHVIDREGNFIYANEVFYKTRGYTLEEIMSLKLYDLVTSENAAVLKNRIAEAAAKGEVVFESSHRCKDGTIIPVEVHTKPIMHNGQTCFLSVVRDITERKKDEIKIIDSEKKYRTVVENAHEGIIVIQDGIVKYINHDKPGTLGFIVSDLYSRPFIEFIHPDDRQFVTDRYRLRLAGEQMDDAVTIRVINAAGATIWIEVHGVMIEWEGKPATLNFVTDITARKEAEEALQKSEERYRTILEQMDEGYYETNLERNLTFLNDALPRMMGYTKEEMLGMNYRQYVPADFQAAHTEAFAKVYRTGIPAELHHQPRIRQDGSTIYVDLFVVPIKNPQGEITGVRGVVRDVTSRQKAEEELQFRAELLNSANDSIYVMDLDGNFIYANETCYKSRGYTQEEFMLSNIHDLIGSGYSAMVDQRVAEVVRKKDLVFESAHLRKDGSIMPVEIHSRAIIHNGQTCLLSTARDITDRRKAECALRKSEEQYRLLAENADDVIWTLDAGMNYTYISPSIRKLSGFEPEEAMQLPLEKVLTPQSQWSMLHELELEWENIIQGKSGPRKIEFEQYRKDGSTVWVETVVHTLYNEAGQLAGFMGSSRDITESKQAEQRLRESEGKFSATFMATSDPSLITEAESGRIIDANPAWEHFIGYSHDELINANIPSLNVWAEPGQREQMLEMLSLQGEVIDHEIKVRTRDGQVRDVLFSARIINVGGKQYLFSRARDITERKRIERSLEQINKRLTDIIEFLPDATLAIDTDNKVILWNRAIEQMTGIAASEMIGKGDYAYTIPFYGEARPFLMDLVLKDSGDIRAKYPYVLRDGDSFIAETYCPALNRGKGAWVYAKASPLHDREGNIVGVIESIRDVTARKQSEEDLQKSEEKYRLLAENADDCIWTMDTMLKPTYVSPSIRKLRGLEPDEAMRETAQDQNAPESLKLVRRELKRALEDANRGIDKSYRAVLEQYRKDRSTVWVETTIRPYRDDAGKFVGFIGVSRDISERKAADEALRESQAKYFELLENAGEAILIAQDGLVKYINNRITEMTGYTAAEFIHTPFIHYVYKDDVDMVSKIHEARMRGEKVEADYVFRVVTVNGEVRWAEIHAALVTWEGRPATLSFLTDITESKKAEEALRESESRYNLLAELTDDVVWVLDRDLRVTYVSPSIRKLSGMEPETFLQEGITNSLTPESLQNVLHLLEVNVPEIGTGADKNAIIELQQYHKDGSIIWIELNVKTQRDATGKFIGFTGTSRDITARKLAEHAIKESEAKFRNIFEQSKDAIFIADKDGNILDVNESMCALTGYSRDEILIAHLMPSKNTLQMLLSAIEKAGSLRDYEYSLHRKDGTFISVLISASMRLDKDGNILGYQGIIHDITERKRLDEERQKTARLESIGTLAGGIAHDFNNILGAVIGNISLAKTEIPAGHNAIDLIKDAEKAIMRAKELTRQLLTFSRGGAPVKKRIQLRNTIIDTANFATRGTNVKCCFNIADDLRPADVDEGQISQVIQNLVINARQAMPTGGEIDITSENIVLAEEMRLGRSLPLSPGTYVRIAVKDKGIGIKPEHLDKIFDPYFTTKQSGSGLGLATCYSIVRNHGGLISVESSPDRGSTFYVYLPASEGPADLAGKDERKEEVRLNGRILVMDDEAALRTTISTMLKRLGFEHIEVAASGEEAMDLYKKALQAKQPFDVVILDLTVPGGMGGRETIEKLREVDPKVIAIVSSGYANEAIMADYTKYGFKGVIVKPYTFDELKSTLHELMDSLKHN